MSSDPDGERVEVLRSKRDATRYRILVEIAERQPAVSQREVADAIGVTAQAVSDYLRDLVEEGYVRKHARGRYEVTKEGVDWLISRTDSLREYVDHVSEEVVGEVELETAVAADDLAEGDTVSMEMRDGVLHATLGGHGSATAVAVTDAAEGTDVGVTNFQGVVDHEVGVVTVLAVPQVRDGGSRAVDPDRVGALADANDLVASAGTEALVAVRTAGVAPDVRFGTAAAVTEAATKGLDVLLVTARSELPGHTAELRDGNVDHEVVDAGTE